MPDHVDTTYICQAYELPRYSNYQIIKYDTIPDQAAVMHHLVVFNCARPRPQGAENFFECPSMPDDCTELVSAWGLGGDMLAYPDDVGDELGRNTGKINLVAQAHYDNPTLLSGVRDSTLTRFWITNKLRPKDASFLTMGLRTRHIAIPPGQKDFTLGASCPSPKTEADPYANLNFFSEFWDGATQDTFAWLYAPHMHKLGTQFWAERYYQNGTFKDYFGQQNPYLFDYQVPHFYEHDPIHQGRVLLDPTDTYKFYCRYDTRDKTSTTMGGDRTQDEMCLFFMGYYPTTPAVLKDKGLEWCLGAPFCEGGADTCGFEHYPF